MWQRGSGAAGQQSEFRGSGAAAAGQRGSMRCPNLRAESSSVVTPVWIFAYDGEVPKYPSNLPKFRLKWPNFIYKSSKIISNIRQISPNFSQKFRFRTIERAPARRRSPPAPAPTTETHSTNFPKFQSKFQSGFPKMSASFSQGFSQSFSRWNRLGQAVKTRKKTGKNRGKMGEIRSKTCAAEHA